MTFSVTTPSNATVSGLRLAHNHLSQEDRARIAADILDHKRPVMPTARQVEVICGVPASRINKHRNNRPKRKPGFTLAKHIAKASSEERANAVEVLGADFIFAAFFEPQLSL